MKKNRINTVLAKWFTLIAGGFMLPLLALADSPVWNNSGDGNWGVGANWSTGIAPSNDSNVTIDNALSKTVTISDSTPVDNRAANTLTLYGVGGATNTLRIINNATMSLYLPYPWQALNVLGGGHLVLDGSYLVSATNTYSTTLGGEVTVLSGGWQGGNLFLNNGTLNLFGGTNSFHVTSAEGGFSGGISFGHNAGCTGTVVMSGGLLVTTNATVVVGNLGRGFMTVSGGRWMGSAFVVGGEGAGSLLTLSGGTSTFDGTSEYGVLPGHSLLMTGGLLVTSNSSRFEVFGSTPGVVVSNGTWVANEIWLRASGKLTMAGGQINASKVGTFYATGGAVTFLVTGGILDANTLVLDSASQIITNSGGVFQFSTATPSISPGPSVIAINGGTIAFRDVADVDVKGNWSGTALVNMTFTPGGQNTFRLNNSTNATSSQSYTFNSGLGATNYCRLEMINGQTCYRGGDVSIGSGGSLLFSNTSARIEGALTQAGAMTVVDSAVTITGALSLSEGAALTWTSNTVGNAVSVGGSVSLPTNATFAWSSPIGRDEVVTLISATGGMVGSPANWEMSPASHRLVVEGGDTLVLRPRVMGFILEIQ